MAPRSPAAEASGRAAAPTGRGARRDGSVALPLEAARAARLTVHAASALCGARPDVARALRAAEGLCRAAVALLAAEPPAELLTAPLAPPSGPPRRRRRRRGRRAAAAAGGGAEAAAVDVVMDPAESTLRAGGVPAAGDATRSPAEVAGPAAPGGAGVAAPEPSTHSARAQSEVDGGGPAESVDVAAGRLEGAPPPGAAAPGRSSAAELPNLDALPPERHLPFAGRLFPVADLERFAERLGTSVDEAKALLACQGVDLLGDGDSAEGRGGGRRSP